MYNSPQKVNIHYKEPSHFSPNKQAPLSPNHNYKDINVTSTKANSPEIKQNFSTDRNNIFYEGGEMRRNWMKEREQYEEKIQMAIQQIDRLNQLLLIKGTQISSLNKHCVKITKDLQDRTGLIEENKRLKEENANLKNQLYKKNQPSSPNSGHNFSFNSLESIQERESSQWDRNESNCSIQRRAFHPHQFPSHQGQKHLDSDAIIRQQQRKIRLLYEKLEIELQKARLQQVEIKELKEKKRLREEHIDFIQKQNQIMERSLKETMEDHIRLKQKVERNYGQPIKLIEKIKQLEKQLDLDEEKLSEKKKQSECMLYLQSS